MTQGNFISRWSQRKLEEKEKQTLVEPVDAQKEALDLQELIKSLPSLETIGAGSDLSPFMQGWVPKDLQNAALKRLWVSDPMITNYVGEALDYAYDYNNPLEGSGFGALPLGYDAMKYVEEMFAKPALVAQETTEIEVVTSSEITEIDAVSSSQEEIKNLPQNQTAT